MSLKPYLPLFVPSSDFGTQREGLIRAEETIRLVLRIVRVLVRPDLVEDPVSLVNQVRVLEVRLGGSEVADSNGAAEDENGDEAAEDGDLDVVEGPLDLPAARDLGASSAPSIAIHGDLCISGGGGQCSSSLLSRESAVLTHVARGYVRESTV